MSRKLNCPPALFLDFDGTITKRDVIDLILERYADERWLLIEEEWRSGRIGSRTCLTEQMELVRTTPEDLNSLLDSVELDEGFTELLRVCAAHRIPAHIVSDGFDYCIRRILQRAMNKFRHAVLRIPWAEMRICASHLESQDGEAWRISFPFFPQVCPHGCATCKPAAMRLLNTTDAPTIFVGDGLSDRYAAASADLLFAKKSLAAYCCEQRIPHVPYENLAGVASYLDDALRRDVDFSVPELTERIGA